jgi:hypothetical protein
MDRYTQSLAIEEELNNRRGMAISYHALGIVAQLRGRLDEAEDWYKRSIAIKEEHGDRPGMAVTFGQLGSLAAQRGNLDQALTWTVRCVALFDDFPHPSTEPCAHNLAQLTHQLGVGVLEASWKHVTGRPLPAAVRAYVSVYRPQRRTQSEEEIDE